MIATINYFLFKYYETSHISQGTSLQVVSFRLKELETNLTNLEEEKKYFTVVHIELLITSHSETTVLSWSSAEKMLKTMSWTLVWIHMNL